MCSFKGLSLAATLTSLLAAPAFAWDAQPVSVPSPPLGVRQAEYPIQSMVPLTGTSLQQCSLLSECEGECEPSNACEGCCSGCGAGDGCGSSLELGGWMSAGIYANAHGCTSNGPLGFNDLSDGFNVHQLWVYAQKAVDTGGCGTDWGYRADFMFGVDGPDTQAFGGLGWDNGWDSSATYGFAMPQLYAELGINDWTIKMGHFYTLIGWEVVPAPDNFFYTHSYSMYYAEPFTHTGVLGSYAWNDNVTVHAGWTQGWDTGFDNTPQANTFLGGVSMALTDKLNFAWMCTAGDFGPDTAAKNALGFANGSIYMNSFVFDWAINDRWTYIFQHDLGVNTPDGGPSTRWAGFNQYLQYTINDCWATGVRIEVFDDPEGARVSYNGLATGTYGELTWGVNWSPRERLTLRPELRYDWFNGLSAADEQPFDNGHASDQLSGGFDVVWTF